MIETNAQLDNGVLYYDQRRREKLLTLTSREFVAGFVPPDYLVDGLMQRRFVYSLTAKTGGGKTAIALLLSAQLARGLPFGPHDVDPGRVLYLAGENSDDVRMRWIAMGEALGYDPAELDVQFIDGRPPIEQVVSRVAAECPHLDLAVVDTAAAFYDGTDENDNVQMLSYAKKLRELSTLPGRPTVLALCHPVKNAGNDNLVPRGGGGFLNEMDGNFAARLKDGVVDMHWQGKFRGRDFDTISFQITPLACETLKDSKGNPIHTVMVKPLSDADRAAVEQKVRRDEDDILVVFGNSFSGSQGDLASTLGWFHTKGSPAKSRVHRALQNLLTDGLVKKREGTSTRSPQRARKRPNVWAETVPKAGTTVHGLISAVPWNVPGRSVEREGAIPFISQRASRKEGGTVVDSNYYLPSVPFQSFY